jgi:hypothetical protein
MAISGLSTEKDYAEVEKFFKVGHSVFLDVLTLMYMWEIRTRILQNTTWHWLRRWIASEPRQHLLRFVTLVLTTANGL